MAQNNLSKSNTVGFFARLATLLSPADEMRVKTHEISAKEVKESRPEVSEYWLCTRQRKHAIPPFPKLL